MARLKGCTASLGVEKSGTFLIGGDQHYDQTISGVILLDVAGVLEKILIAQQRRLAFVMF